MSTGARYPGEGLVATAGDWVAHVCRALAFWTAVVLPFLYVPLLAGGLAGQEAVAFGGLLVVNVVAVVVGHDHAAGSTRDRGGSDE